MRARVRADLSGSPCPSGTQGFTARWLNRRSSTSGCSRATSEIIAHEEPLAETRAGWLFHSSTYLVKGRSNHHQRMNTSECSIILNRSASTEATTREDLELQSMMSGSECSANASSASGRLWPSLAPHLGFLHIADVPVLLFSNI